MGRVSLAERDDLDLPVVVKRIHSEHAADARFRRRLLREAEVAAQLEHPNVVRVLDTGVIDDQLYMAMEYVPGSSLAGILAASRPELLPVAPVLNAIAQACDGLAYVHRFCEPRSGRWMQLVHRDVSVDNLLVSYSGEVKLADFGIVKMADSTQTTSGVIMGKLGYMSPEQLRDESLDGRSDLYSLGVCLFELLAGRRPLPAHRGRSVMEAVLYDPPVPLEQLRPDLPPRLVALVTRLLAKDRKARPLGGDEVVAELRALLAERDEPLLFPSKLLEAPPKNRAKPRLEPATEVEMLAATKPQRLAGPGDLPAAQGAPARRPSQVDAPVPVPARRPSQEAIPEAAPRGHHETSVAPPPTRRPSQDMDTAIAPPPRRKPSPEMDTAIAPPPARRSSPELPTAAPGRDPAYEVPTAVPGRRASSQQVPVQDAQAYEVPTAVPGRRPSSHQVPLQDAQEPAPGQGVQSTRLLTAAPSRRPPQWLRWAALGGGMVLVGAAAAWLWA
jgi:serine/threonine-protein kinase